MKPSVAATNSIKFTLCSASNGKPAITVEVTKCKTVEEGKEKMLKNTPPKKKDTKEKRRQSKGGNKFKVRNSTEKAQVDTREEVNEVWGKKEKGRKNT